MINEPIAIPDVLEDGTSRDLRAAMGIILPQHFARPEARRIASQGEVMMHGTETHEEVRMMFIATLMDQAHAMILTFDQHYPFPDEPTE